MIDTSHAILIGIACLTLGWALGLVSMWLRGGVSRIRWTKPAVVNAPNEAVRHAWIEVYDPAVRRVRLLRVPLHDYYRHAESAAHNTADLRVRPG